ncbi:MAG: rRNA adenine N-6-methyltransferase family protein [Nocardioides sp.]
MAEKHPWPTPDTGLEQHFLTSTTKIDAIVLAAGVGGNDRVVEVGAGVGTVAVRLPACRSLTLVEFDARLCQVLERLLPRAHVR